MKVSRNIDELGRVVLPREMRDQLEFEPGQPVYLETRAKGGILIRKVAPACFCCGKSAGELIKVKGRRYLCRSCLQKAVEKAQK